MPSAGEEPGDVLTIKELAAYLKETDPYDHLTCYHAPGHPRSALKDNSMFDFDMIAIGHEVMTPMANRDTSLWAQHRDTTSGGLTH